VNGDVIDFDKLAGADPVIDCIYRGGPFGDTRDDPLSKLLRVGNQGRFRIAGSAVKDSVKLAPTRVVRACKKDHTYASMAEIEQVRAEARAKSGPKSCRTPT
jgi:hypothetical protein